ncbi:uncharacterized protein LOC117100386, partial [Anneissia japonica]|uniref:uncharacterized protein LOC117100386 n=1 Tax=Anneissia japonica TaxID=1529436 RepID=UPI001425BB82
AYSTQAQISDKLQQSSINLEKCTNDTKGEVNKCLQIIYKQKLIHDLKLKSDKISKLAGRNPQLKHLQSINHPVLLSRFPNEFHNHQQIEGKKLNQFVNLSNHSLTQGEQSILNKGLSYCPSQKPDPVNLCSDFHMFTRRIQLKEFFQDKQLAANHTLQRQNNLVKEFNPPTGRNQFIDAYINSATSHLNSFLNEVQCKKLQDNMTKEERKAISTLKANDDIVIRQADKGGATTIMSQTSYIEEANEQLSNTTFYKKLDKDHTVDFKRELLNMTKGLSTHTRSHMPALIPRNPQP